MYKASPRLAGLEVALEMGQGILLAFPTYTEVCEEKLQNVTK